MEAPGNHPIVCLIMAIFSIALGTLGTFAHQLHDMAEFFVPFFQLTIFSLSGMAAVVAIRNGGGFFGLFKKKRK